MSLKKHEVTCTINSDDRQHFGGRCGSTKRVKITLVGESGTIIDFPGATRFFLLLILLLHVYYNYKNETLIHAD